MSWINWPNRITLTRIVLIAPLVICLLNLNAGWVGWRYLSGGLLSVMILSDAVDGFLARRLDQVTSLGRFLDPLADKLLITATVILLSIEATAIPGFRLPSWVPVVVVGKDLLTVLGFVLVYTTTGRLLIQPRIWGKACTAVQLLMVLYCLFVPDVVVRHAHTVLEALYWSAAALAVIALADYIRLASRFSAHHASGRRG